MRTRSPLLLALPLAFTAGLAVAACGSSSSTSSSASSKTGVEVSNAWVRPSPAGATTGAAYVTMKSAADDNLLKVAVDPSVAKEAQVHATMDNGGQMSMQPVDKLALPAGKEVAMKPGGYHIMLMDLASQLKAGTKVPLTLTFEKAGSKVVQADVRDG